jgi:hypothetical protein
MPLPYYQGNHSLRDFLSDSSATRSRHPYQIAACDLERQESGVQDVCQFVAQLEAVFRSANS